MQVVASPAYANRVFNPYNWLLHTHLARLGLEVRGATPLRLWRGECDLWHVHWPDALLNQRSAFGARAALAGLLALMERARSRGVRIVWTVHNLHAHEGAHPALERIFWKAFIPLVDGHVSMTHAAQASAVARFPRLAQVPGFVIPHGDYRGVYPDRISRIEARRRLAVPRDARVAAFVGRVRAYKNVPHLVRAFAAMDDNQARLLIAGRASPAELGHGIRALASRDARVHLYPGHVATREMQLYLRAADMVVLPYQDILNSGSALLALSFDCPVLVPALGSLGELRETVGSAWVRTYVGELTPGTLAAALEWAREPRTTSRAPLDRFGWPAIAAATLDAYRCIAASP